MGCRSSSCGARSVSRWLDPEARSPSDIMFEADIPVSYRFEMSQLLSPSKSTDQQMSTKEPAVEERWRVRWNRLPVPRQKHLLYGFEPNSFQRVYLSNTGWIVYIRWIKWAEEGALSIDLIRRVDKNTSCTASSPILVSAYV